MLFAESEIAFGQYRVAVEISDLANGMVRRCAITDETACISVDRLDPRTITRCTEVPNWLVERVLVGDRLSSVVGRTRRVATVVRVYLLVTLGAHRPPPRAVLRL